MDAVEQAIHAALKQNAKNFEAIALVQADRPHIVALDTVEGVRDDLAPALKRFLYRITLDSDQYHHLADLNHVIYYDLQERQVICNLIEGAGQRYVLVIVTGPKKAYKRASKQLLKTLQPLLAT